MNMDKFLIVNPETGNLSIWYRLYEDWWHQVFCLSGCQDDEWKLEDDISLPKDYLGKCELSEEYIKNNMEIFYEYKDFDIAAKKSKELWDNFYKPSSLYKVAQYFDDIFEHYVSEAMSKKDARKEQDRLNNSNKRYLVSYEIRPIN